MNSEYSDDFYVTGKGCMSIFVMKKEYVQRFSMSGPNYNDYSAPFNFTPDQILVERLKKRLRL
jgi:hypothetical protein